MLIGDPDFLNRAGARLGGSDLGLLGVQYVETPPFA
jgi:hypothetical protein